MIFRCYFTATIYSGHIHWTIHHYSLYLITVQGTQASLFGQISVRVPCKDIFNKQSIIHISVWYAFYTKRIQIEIRTIVLLTWRFNCHPIIITSPLFAGSHIDDCYSLVAKYSPTHSTFFFLHYHHNFTPFLLPCYFPQRIIMFISTSSSIYATCMPLMHAV